MIVRLWGTRGSLASSGPETAGYGGNTASVEIVSADGTILVLDAGTGIRRLGAAIDPSVERLDILLTHLHMDHIQGLGFFAPFFRPSGEIHVWGPASATMDLRTRLTRYLSPPLFPVRIRDLDARVVLHDAPEEPVASAASRSLPSMSSIQDPRSVTGSPPTGRALPICPTMSRHSVRVGFPTSRAGRPASILPQASISSSTTGSTRMTSARCGSAGVTARSARQSPSPSWRGFADSSSSTTTHPIAMPCSTS